MVGEGSNAEAQRMRGESREEGAEGSGSEEAEEEKNMSASHVRMQKSAQESGQGRRERQGGHAAGENQAQPAPGETPLWELLAGVVGLLLVLGVLGVLLYEASRPQTAASIVTEVLSIAQQPSGYVVTFEAANEGRTTAASVLLQGELYDPATSDEPVETAEVTFDYIPDRSARTGAFVFEHDPRQRELRILVKGFMDP